MYNAFYAHTKHTRLRACIWRTHFTTANIYANGLPEFTLSPLRSLLSRCPQTTTVLARARVACNQCTPRNANTQTQTHTDHKGEAVPHISAHEKPRKSPTRMRRRGSCALFGRKTTRATFYLHAPFSRACLWVCRFWVRNVAADSHLKGACAHIKRTCRAQSLAAVGVNNARGKNACSLARSK